MLLVSLQASLAVAQSNVKEETTLARQALEEGNKLQLEEKYAEAILMYEKGYRIHQAAIFRHAQAFAAWELGNLEKAIDYARRAAGSNDVPLGPSTALKNQAYLRAWQTQLEANNLSRRLAERRRRELSAQAFRPGWKTWTGIGMASAGLGLGIYALVLGEQVSEDNAALAGLPYNEYQRQRSDVEDQQFVGKIVLFSAIGLGVVGASLIAWDVLEPREAQFTWGIAPAKSGASAHVGWEW